MAVYHLRLKVHSRSLGRAARAGGATRRSAVAAAAYRSGQRLYDDSQGKWFSFDKPDVVYTEIMLPSADAPAWMSDRQTLWNVVERCEKRLDAQLCREVELTLPRELTPEQRIDLVRRFVAEEFVSKGMVADISVHVPDAADGREQPHAHVLLTLRRLDPASPTGFSATKERDWNEREDIARFVAEARKRFNNTGLDSDKAALEAAEALRNVNVWRAEWAAYANRALAAVGSEARIDHRTLEKQGIFRAPQISLGIARHIEKAYGYLKERITQWVAIKHRADLYEEVEHYKRRDPVKLAEFVLRLADMAEGFAASFRKQPDIPEVPHDR
ncbi:MobQ family relaxase [Phenylobacterium sp.]|uniref:MobQ family relaxase n=1 Tax=Phenylobacterium sp. TaxID=1871053 RepID=UPI0027211F35|nr:MobQ family relaxase [Phenylobacterium sp.]MDO8381014.1 MobQ family relaxase [Phenylobacterium sp.]